MFWPFNIPAKRREREAQQRAEEARRLQRIKESVEAENRRQLQRSATITSASGYRAAVARQQQASVAPAQRNTTAGSYDDPLSQLNPLSPLNPVNQGSNWSVSADEPRHSSGDCGSSSSSHSHDHGSSWSSSDHSSSHSHSSSDYSCSSSSYDSSSSSSYDSGSSSSSSD